jgi:hypothetical protein
MASKGTPAFGVQLDLLGTRGRIVVGDGETRAWQGAADEGPVQPRAVTWRQGIDEGLGNRLVPAVDHLIAMLREGVPADSPPRAARDVLELMLGALRSQAQGMIPVPLPLPRDANG